MQSNSCRVHRVGECLAAATLLLSGCYDGRSNFTDDGADVLDTAESGNSGKSDDGSEGGPEGTSGGAETGGTEAGEADGGHSDAGGDTENPDVARTDPGTRPLRRLTVLEYNNTLRDMFEVDVALPSSFPPDSAAEGFDNTAAVQTLTDVHLEFYRDTVATAIDAAIASAQPPRWMVCPPSEGPDCVREVLTTFLPLALRRPAQPEDLEQLMALYDSIVADGGTPEEGLSLALQAAMLSPRFLFLLEIDTDPAASTSRPLDDWELASRLSYFLWSSMPDDELFAAASEGRLQNDAELSAQVRRMLADEKAEALIDSFGAQYLPLRRLQSAAPDPEMFPLFDESLRDAMEEETRRLLATVLLEGRPVTDLVASDTTYANDRLAELYGYPPPGSADFQPVTGIGAYHRSGVLTHASFLTAFGKPTDAGTVLRGHWTLSHLLCIDVPPPPPAVPSLPDPVDLESKRDQLERHRTDSTCRGCHIMMDPLGLALETYDSIGQYREMDRGLPIITADELPDGRTFENAVDLSQLIADDPNYPACLAEHFFVFALGRDLATSQDRYAMDHVVLEEITTSFVENGLQMEALIEEIVLSPSFRTRRGEGAQ